VTENPPYDSSYKFLRPEFPICMGKLFPQATIPKLLFASRCGREVLNLVEARRGEAELSTSR
jgi:hypothetical protein